jgi:integrase
VGQVGRKAKGQRQEGRGGQEGRQTMSIYKRGEVYWYKFMWKGELVRESTKQGNDKVARQMEAAHRTSLAKGEVGIREKKPAPTLREFIRERFEPWCRATASPRTWRDHYAVGVRAILGFQPLASNRLNQITSEHIAQYVMARQAKGLAVSTINGNLRVLRRILGLAVEWGALESVPKIKRLPGEHHREHVIGADEEERYLAAAPSLLASVAMVLFDTGMRPDEAFRLRWEAITWVNGRSGSLLVTHGKTAAARRPLPMTPGVRATLEAHWHARGCPAEGWVFAAPTRSGHIEGFSLRKQHHRALLLSGVRPFVLYSIRHTFLTRLGASGCDAWTLARIAGHSSAAMSSRYVHPQEDTVLTAMERLGGHRIGHREAEVPREQPNRIALNA